MLFAFVWSENQTDNQFKKEQNVYRLVREINNRNNSYETPTLSGYYYEILQERLQPSTITRVYRDDELVTYNESSFFESNFLYVDDNFFEILDFPFTQGNPESALGYPNSVVITEKIASKYFGERNPIGQTIDIDKKGTLQITGVISQNFKSHLKLDFIASNKALGYASRLLTDKSAHAMSFYLNMIQSDFNLATEKISGFCNEYLNQESSEETTNLELQPVTEIYFEGPLIFDIADHGNPFIIKSSIAIGTVIFILIVLNLTNSTFVKLASQIRAIAVRKILGSSKNELVLHWFSKLSVAVFVAILIGFTSFYGLIPFLNKEFELDILLPSPLLMTIIAVMFGLIMTLFIGLIPFLLFSKIKSSAALADRTKSIRTKGIQYLLLLFQLVVSSVLIVLTINMDRQFQYIQTKDLGLNYEKLLVFNSNNKDSWKNRNHIKNSIKELPSVRNAITVYGGLPSTSTEVASIQINNESFQWKTAFVEPGFEEMMSLRILDGTRLSDKTSMINSSVILNETAAKAIGWPEKNIIGYKVVLNDNGGMERKVVGVINDYHFQSFKNKIDPLVLLSTDSEETFVVKLNGQDYQKTLSEIENIWNSYVPKYPFTYQFLDDTFTRLHQSEMDQKKIVSSFSFLAIVIAAIGVLSLSGFIQNSRVGEIAIRKVLGAPLINIFYHLCSSLIGLLFLSMAIATPISLVFLSEWLNEFSYRIDITILPFLSAFLVIFFVIGLVIVAQTWKTAMANPINSLKSE